MSNKILTACTQLHNFIIENDWQQCNEAITAADVVGSLSKIYCPSLSTSETQAGVSFLRNKIVPFFLENGYRLPSYNRLRNNGLNYEVYERHQLAYVLILLLKFQLLHTNAARTIHELVQLFEI
jgi:hypothetical protein